MRERLLIYAPQLLDRRIRIRRRLKVREEVVALPIPHPHPFDALTDVSANPGPRQRGAGAETTVAAKRATAGRHRAIHVRAGKSCVDTDLLYPSPETLLEKEITRVVRQTGI